jgi:hypothetical protein
MYKLQYSQTNKLRKKHAAQLAVAEHSKTDNDEDLYSGETEPATLPEFTRWYNAMKAVRVFVLFDQNFTDCLKMCNPLFGCIKTL